MVLVQQPMKSDDMIMISVILPTRNRADRLKLTIDALMADDYPKLEVIVCDGASTDGTVELLKSYGDRVRWVSEKDGGEFQARNKAVGMARGEIIRYLSDDDIPVPGTHAVAARYLADHPDVDILFGQSVNHYVRTNGETVVSDERPTTPQSLTIDNFIYGRQRYAVSETAFFRRNVAAAIGPFDTVRGADYEYWARAVSRGMVLAVADDVFVHHYRFEAGEIKMRGIYRDLLRASGMLAERYGTAWDRVYVRGIWLPYRLLKYDLIGALPPKVAFKLRAAVWRLRGRGIAQVS
jgi:glycosyltransferase involved in cell wall biosynthesis